MNTGARYGSSRRRRFQVVCVVAVLLAMVWTSLAGLVAAQPAGQPMPGEDPAQHERTAEGAAPLAHRAEDTGNGRSGDATDDSAADDRGQAFVAVEGATQEEISGGPLLLGAYALVWLFLLAYVVVLARRTSRAEQEVARLADVLRQRSS